MKKYRILGNGRKFRVQRHVRFGPINYWKHERLYEVRDSYPKVVSRLVEFDALDEARSYIRERLKEEKPSHRWWPFALPKGWQIVEKFSDDPKPPTSATRRKATASSA
jgi:hypothetical protein